MEKFIVLDVESCPIDSTVEEVRADNQFVYDVGWAIVDKEGNVYETQSFVVAEIFLQKELMKNAFYADKIPTYWNEIKQGKRTLTSFDKIRKALWKDIKLYNVGSVFAHNCRFDYTALNRTQRYLTKSKYRYFFPYGIEICDTLKMSRKTIGQLDEYKEFCNEHGYITKRNQLRFTAEILYRFLTDNLDFEEVHCGLEDVLIEKEILKECLKIDEEVERNLFKPREIKFQTKFI